MTPPPLRPVSSRDRGALAHRTCYTRSITQFYHGKMGWHARPAHTAGVLGLAKPKTTAITLGQRLARRWRLRAPGLTRGGVSWDGGLRERPELLLLRRSTACGQRACQGHVAAARWGWDDADARNRLVTICAPSACRVKPRAGTALHSPRARRAREITRLPLLPRRRQQPRPLPLPPLARRQRGPPRDALRR